MRDYATDRPVNQIRYNKHPRRKNNEIVAAMYAMYKRGPEGKPCSLEEIASVYKKSRQAVYDLFRSRGYPLRSKQLKGLTIVDGFRFTISKGGYLRGTVRGKRVMLHVYVWEKVNGKIGNDYCLHHIDRNPLNNDLGNLQRIPKREMPWRFNPEGKNQYTNEKNNNTRRRI